MRPMKPYSEDLRVRIVSAFQEESMSKSAAAHLFGVSLSSVKRYARMADRRTSLAPTLRPGQEVVLIDNLSLFTSELASGSSSKSGAARLCTCRPTHQI